MNWVFLALLAPFVYALNVFTDKYLISSRLKDYRSLPMFSGFVAFLFALIYWPISGLVQLGGYDSLLVILSGVFTIVGFSLYLEALVKEETSLIIVLIQLIPVFVLILSLVFLGETITFKQLLGFGLLITASIGASLKKSKSSWGLTKGVWFIVLADLVWSAAFILIKMSSQAVSLEALLIYESLGVMVGAICLFLLLPGIRKALINSLRVLKPSDFGLVTFNECLYLGGKALTYIAVALGPVAIVSVLGSTQIFYGILIGAVLTFVLPKVFKEDLTKEGIRKKLILGLIAVVGVFLVS